MLKKFGVGEVLIRVLMYICIKINFHITVFLEIIPTQAEKLLFGESWLFEDDT